MMRALPLNRRALAALGLAVATGAGGYVTLVRPKAQAIAQLEGQLTLVSAALPRAAVPATAVGDTERQLWRELESRLHARFVAPSDQVRALDEVGRMASDAGLFLTGVTMEDPQVRRTLRTPGDLAVNPGSIRLTARHRYAELIDFLEALRHGQTYVVLESLDVRRVDDQLASEIRLISLRWEK